MRPLRAVSGLCSLALLGALAACASSQATSDDAGLGPGLPKVGQCRVLTESDIAPASNETPTVACAKPHTAETIAVGSFPVSAVTEPRVASGALGDDALRACTRAWKRVVGGDETKQHLSLLDLAYFLPNRDQLSDGARWYRCDVVLGGQDGLALQDLPADVNGILDGQVPDSLLACRTAPDFGSGRTVPCSDTHVLRAVGTAKLPGGQTFPGNAALSSASKEVCAPVIRSWLGERVDGGDAYQWPDRVGWELQGDHWATCWTVATG